MPIGGHLTSVAKALLEIDKGPFDEGLHQARRDIRSFAAEGTGALRGLTDAQLKVKVAENELTGAIRRRGETSNSAIRATLKLRAAERELAQESLQAAAAERKQLVELRKLAEHKGLAGKAFLLFNRNVRTATDGVDEHGRALKRAGDHHHRFGERVRVRERLGHGASFVGSGLLGLGAGFAAEEVIRTSVDAATEEAAAVRALRTQLDKLGISYAGNRKQIDETIEKQGDLSKFTNHELLGSFTQLVRRTGDVDQALKLNGVAADIARAKHKDLATVSTLLIRALAGNSRAATALGLPLVTVTSHMDALRASGQLLSRDQIARAKAQDKEATGWAIITRAQRLYAGQARANVTPQQLLNRELHETEVVIGKQLSPTINGLRTRLANYLQHARQTGQLQRTVNTVLHDTGAIAKVVAGGFRLLSGAIRTVNHVTGSTKHTVELLAGAFLAFKIGALVGKFARFVTTMINLTRAVKTLGKTSVVTAGEVNILKDAEERPDTGIPGPRGAGGSRLSRFARRFAGLGAKARLGVGLGAVAVTALAFPDETSKQGDSLPVWNGKAWVDPSTGLPVADQAYWMSEWRKNHLGADTPILRQNAYAGGSSAPFTRSFSPDNRGFVAGVGKAGRDGSVGGVGGGGGTRDPFADVRLDDTGGLVLPFAIRLALAKNPDNEKALVQEEAYIKRAISSHKLKGENLIAAFGELHDIDGQLADKAKQRADAAAKRAKQREHAAITLPQRLLARFAVAERKGDVAGEIAALEAEQSELRKRIVANHGNLRVETALNRELHQVDVKIAALRKQRTRDRLVAKQSNLQRRIDDAQTALDNAEEGTPKWRRARAALLKAYNAEIAFYRAQERNSKLSAAARARAARQIAADTRAKKQLLQQQQVDEAALVRGAIDTLQTIIQNESNFRLPDTTPVLNDMHGTLKQIHTRLFQSENHLLNIRYGQAGAGNPGATRARLASEADFA